MYPTPPSSYENDSPINTFMSNFEMDVDEDAPSVSLNLFAAEVSRLTLNQMDLVKTSILSSRESSPAVPLSDIGYNYMQLPEPEPEAPLVGRLGTPPPPEQPPSLASSYDSASSDGDFQELYYAYLSEVLTDGGVVDLPDGGLRLYYGDDGDFVNNVETVTAGLAAMDLTAHEAEMDAYPAFDVEYTEVKDYDANAIVQDVWRFTPTDEDRALLCAPFLTTVDLPDVDSAASSGYFGYDAY